MRGQDLQQVVVLGHNRQVHDALRQDPSVYRLREVDGATQEVMNFPQIRVSSVGESDAYRVEMAVRLPVQRADKPGRDEFEKLPVRLIKLLHMADGQSYLILASRDINDESFICGFAVTREVFERF